VASKNNSEEAGGRDSLDELEVQLSLEDHARSMVVVESVSSRDGDVEAIGGADVGLGRVFILGCEEGKRLCDSEHLSSIWLLQ
jgi:hypothetical protein